MFVMYEKEKMKVPVRVWLKEREDLKEAVWNRHIIFHSCLSFISGSV